MNIGLTDAELASIRADIADLLPDTCIIIAVTNTADSMGGYTRGILKFSDNTAGSAYFLNGESYDIYRAASDVWHTKAAHHSGAVDFSTDNMTVKRGQLIENDIRMANYYAGMGRVKIVQYDRDDTT